MNPEVRDNIKAETILTLPLSWPRPLRGVERIWRNISGQQQAYRKGLENGVRLAADTVSDRIGNALSPAVGYAELLSIRPSIQSDPKAAEYAQRIARSANDVTRIIRLLNGFQRIAFDKSRESDTEILDLEASSQPHP